MTQQFRLFWIFRNNNAWHKDFPTKPLMMEYIESCGLFSHPDVIDLHWYDSIRDETTELVSFTSL